MPHPCVSGQHAWINSAFLFNAQSLRPWPPARGLIEKSRGLIRIKYSRATIGSNPQNCPGPLQTSRDHCRCQVFSTINMKTRTNFQPAGVAGVSVFRVTASCPSVKGNAGFLQIRKRLLFGSRRRPRYFLLAVSHTQTWNPPVGANQDVRTTRNTICES